MPSSSPERGRPRSRQQNSAHAKSPTQSKSRSPPRRSISPRSTPAGSRAPSVRGERVNGVRNGRNRSRSYTRSASRSRSRGQAARPARDRSYTRSRSRGSPPKSSKIVVEKLTKNVSEGHLHEIFGAYGSIRELDLPMNRQFMTNRGTAYIVYTSTPDAEAAIAHMHEAQLDGAIINVSIVLPRRKFSRSPPPSRRGAPPPYDRFEARGPPPGNYRGGPPPPPHDRYGRDAPPMGGGRYRSPPPRRGSPPRRYGGGRPGPRDRDLDTYRPRSYSRSRTRSRSFSSRSRSRSPPRRHGGYRRRDSPPQPRGGGRRRSPSYSSFSSYSDRSRSRSRGRYGRGRGY